MKKPGSKENPYIVCVLVFAMKNPSDKSVITKCCNCHRKVWVSPWHHSKVPICVECVTKKIINTDEELSFGTTEKDLEEARRTIGKRRKNE